MANIEKLRERYLALCHAVQTGSAYHIQTSAPGDTNPASPKHLRTGINIAMRDHASVVKLLMQKAVITEEEYMQALVDGMEEEVAMLEALLNDRYGGKNVIKLK